MIDWDKPSEPDFVPGNVRMVDIYTIRDAMRLLDEWIKAYEDLRTEHARLWHKYEKLLFDAEMDYNFRRHLDPFLPDHLQNEEWREKEPGVYAALKEHRK